MIDEAEGVDISAAFTIPQDFLVELDLPIHAGFDVDPAKFYVKNIGAYATGFSIVVGYESDSGPIDVATALIPAVTHERNTQYALGGIGDFSDTVGKVVIGRLEAIQEQPAGFFEFDIDNTRLEPDAIRPNIRGVSSLLVNSDNDQSQRLTGDIELQPGTNMQIVPVIVEGQDPILIFSALEGEGLAEECVCDDDFESPPIKRINGIPPTAAGDFTILGNACLEVNEIANGVMLDDVCSEPCCGCEELEAITRDLEQFGSKATTLENFLVRLETEVSQMNMVVLGATLRDEGCLPCATE
jgi:hypothetical protein